MKQKRVTIDQILEAVRRDDNIGFCRDCGAEAMGVEPDARQYECESCGTNRVYGAQELMFMEVA